MTSKENKTILQEACKKRFDETKVPIYYSEYTKLGLVEATRPKQNIDIYEFFRKNDKTILL